MELMERFEAATGGGPEHRPIESRLTDGRQAVRRRRLTVGASALATLAIVGTGWAMLPGDSVQGAEVTGTPTVTGGPTAEHLGELRSEADRLCRKLETLGDIQSYRQTAGADPGELDLTDCVSVRNVGSRDAAGRPLVNAVATFVGLVGGKLVSADGVTVIDSIRNPHVAGFSRPGVETAAATVRYDNETWFVLTSDGSLRQRFGRQSPATPTLDAFLAAKASGG